MEDLENTVACDTTSLLFPNYSSTLLIGPSYSGKTTFLINILESYPVFFDEKPPTVHVFQNGSAAKFPQLKVAKGLSKLRIERYDAEEYSDGLLEKGDVVIFEDIAKVTDDIRSCLTVHTHHKGITSFFIVHSTFRSRLFDIYSLVHRVLFFCANGTVARQAGYVIQTHFSDKFIRGILKSALAFAEREKEVLQLELNAPAQLRPIQFLAATHVRSLGLKTEKLRFAYIFLHPFDKGKLTRLWGHASAALEEIEKGNMEAQKTIPFPLDKMPDRIPESAFVLAPAEVVQAWFEADLNSAIAAGEEECQSGLESESSAKKQQEKAFNDAANAIQGLIEDTMPARQHFAAKALAKEILKSNAISLSADGREIWITGSEVGQPDYDDSESSLASLEYGHDHDYKVPIIDFLSVSTRRTTPQEAKKRGKDWKRYAEIVQQLLLNKCPRLLFKNAALLKMSAVGKKAYKRNKRDCCRYHSGKESKRKLRKLIGKKKL